MSWFDNPAELFRSSEILSFWPNNKQSADERINASTRFILYLACILYLIKRDSRIMFLAFMILGLLYIFHKSGVVKDGISVSAGDCQSPTEDNPMANVLMTDYTDNPNRPEACFYPTVQKDVKKWIDKTFQFDSGRSRSPLPVHQRNAAARQFVSNPVTSIPGDQTAFAEWCYGKKFAPLCRDGGTCDPNYWGVQSEAFAGLDSSNNPRRV